MSADSLNTSAPGEMPRESRTAQFYQATEPSYVHFGQVGYDAALSPDLVKNHQARLQAFSDSQWAKKPTPVEGEEDGPEYREPRSWRDNPLYNQHLH